MPLKNKRLRIMAGPNGGKSTILQGVRKNFYSDPFINADEIERALKVKRVINLPSLYDLVDICPPGTTSVHQLRYAKQPT